MYIEGNIELCSLKKFYPAKEMINELLRVFVAIIILHAKRIRGILLLSVAYLNVPYIYSPYLIKGKS